ncbi:MAG: DUF1847 domain-containing protein [Lachnospiraceae bacterium]|nr:DUF1847 domain-containing protein [Lachnospiraceae bacterium]
MEEKKEIRKFSCADCGVLNCANRASKYPEFCPTAALSDEEIDKVVLLYTNNKVNHKVAIASAEVEGSYYGKASRVEEIIHFARRIGAKKIGIATCVGLIEESRIFAKILRLNGFEVYGIGCKVGSVNKTAIGVDEKHTCVTGSVMCNPIMQAKLLNKEKVDLNVVVGLCVGHDSLFYKYANGLSTTLITKDRVLAHNPAGALYQSRAYYKRLLESPVAEEVIEQ